MVLTACAAAFAQSTDAARLFLGNWEGPANVFDEQNVATPTNAKLSIFPAPNDPRRYVVELTLFGDKVSRFTRSTLVDDHELRVRDDVLVELRRVRADGVLRTSDGVRIEEGYIRFFVDDGGGDFRPYYAVKLMAKRVASSRATPTPPASTPGH
jgi:hypothetical protein